MTNIMDTTNTTDTTYTTDTTPNNKIKISGSIGMVQLKNNDKNVYIYYDDHSNIKYCSSNDSIFLYGLFENIIGKNFDHIVLLEEPFVNNYSNIKFLWNDTPHVIKFRNFYKKIIKKCSDTKKCYVFPVDIRLIICDVSFDELLSNIDNKQYSDDYNITTNEYFKYILYLFDYIGYNDETFKNCDKNILFIKKIFDKFNSSEYYHKLSGQFDILYNNYIRPNLTLKIFDFINMYNNGSYSFFSGYPYENINPNSNENNFFDQYDKLINGIMEFYIFILVTGLSYKNISIYTGYYHSNNLAYILKKYYNYKQIYSVGNTENIEKINEKDISNCLYIDKKIFNN